MNKRFLSLGSAVAVVLGLMIPVTAPTALAAAAPCLSPGTLGTHAVAVDAGGGAFGEAPPPVGHNYEFVDYFPRGGAAPVVENGDCLQFNFDGGFHTVSFFTSSDSPATHPWTTKPFAVPDTGSTDTGEGPLVNPGAFAPSPPTCGVFATPCGLTGTGFTNSGGNGGGGTWWAKLNLTNAGFTGSLWYFCLIHPSMSGHVTVALPAAAARTSPATENAVALTQYSGDLVEAATAEGTANAATTTTNADGTHTIQAKAGASSAHVELDEMFPGGPATAGCPQFQPQCWKGSLTVTAGDKVIWTYTGAKNVHTVTFPQGTGSNGVDPFKPTVCEGTGSVDPPPPVPGPPPFFGCLNMKPEQPLDPAPHGPSAIADGTTVATSGILGSSPSPFPQSHAFTFPNVNAGLTYQCRIHDNMIGVVQVLAAAIVPPTPALPKAGHDMRRAIPAGNTGIVLVFAVLALIALLPAARFAIRKRR